jgi:hypothetical protein
MSTYRNQTTSALGEVTDCTTCFTTLSLKFATTEAGLCCATVTPADYYVVQGQTFANATAFYSNSALTTRADNGYYGV